MAQIVQLAGCATPWQILESGQLLCPLSDQLFFTVDSDVLQSSKVQVQLPAERLDETRTADIQEVFYAFMVVFAAVWAVKKLLNLFSSDIER